MKLKSFLLTSLLVSATGAAERPPGLKLMLPEEIYAAPGIESCIYFRNAVDSAVPDQYACEVRCQKGRQGKYRWFWTPGPEDAGKSYELELRLFNDYGLAVSGKTRIVVAGTAADPKRKITLALLVDSGINCGYPKKLMTLMHSNGFSNYTPVGDLSGICEKAKPGDAAHDGYGGFTWGAFLDRWWYSDEELPTVQSEAERQQMRRLGVLKYPKSDAWRLRSPLLRLENGKKILDIPGWLKRINGGNAPDFIVIELGLNDVFSFRPENQAAGVAKVMGHARKLLSELRKHAPDAVIGVATATTGCGQDGFGTNYGCGQSEYQFRRNIHCYNRELAGMVRKLADPKIVIVPLHQCIDPENSYLTSEVPAHARSARKIRRDRNALHASWEGGMQLADALYCWLRKQLEK